MRHEEIELDKTFVGPRTPIFPFGDEVMHVGQSSPALMSVHMNVAAIIQIPLLMQF